MNRQIRRLVLTAQQTAMCALLGLSAGLASAGVVDYDTPRLLSGDGAFESPSVVLQGSMRPAGYEDSQIVALRRSMLQLGEQQVPALPLKPGHLKSGDRLQTALHKLSGSVRPPLTSPAASTEPRIATPVDHHPTGVSKIADLKSQLVRIRKVEGSNARLAARPVPGLSTLHRAMRRFDRTSGVVASDTFARVYVGMDDTVPKLSNLAARHSSVPTRDLRTRLVDSRTAAAASSSPMPSLVTAASGLRLGDVDLPASASTELTDLVGPLDQVALSDVAGRSDTQLLGQPSDDAQYALGDIALDDLGVGLAGVEAPVDIDQLQETRAGFLLDNGIIVDFSVTRSTTIDGLNQQQLQNLTDMPGGIDQGRLTQIAAGPGGNARVITPANGSSAFTVVQNSLDNQSILDVTTFNIDIKGAGLRSLDFIPQSFLPEALPPEVR